MRTSFKWGLSLTGTGLLFGLYFNSKIFISGDEGFFYLFLTIIILFLHLVGLFLIRKNIQNQLLRVLMIIYAFLAVSYIIFPIFSRILGY